MSVLVGKWLVFYVFILWRPFNYGCGVIYRDNYEEERGCGWVGGFINNSEV